MRLWLDRMDEIRKLHAILDEEDRNIIADQIKIAFFGIEFHAKPRTSLARSVDPRDPTTVEKRTNTGVL